MNNLEPVIPQFYVIDASVWVSRLVESDQMHIQVKNWMERQRAGGAVFISPVFLLAEVGGAITRRTGEARLGRQAITALENLPRFRLVSVDDKLMGVAIQLAADLGLRGADSVYVAAAYHLDLPLVSLDVDQQQRAGQRVKILPPSD